MYDNAQGSFNDPINPQYQVVRGIVKRILFYSPENDHCAAVITQSTGGEITVKGNMVIAENDPLIFYGNYVNHQKYGNQLEVSHLSYDTKPTKQGLKMYLWKNPAFRGIGEQKAELIAKYYSDNFEEILFSNPKEMQERCKLFESDIETLQKVWKENAEVNIASTKLAGYELSHNQIKKLLKENGMKIVGIIEKNPYLLIDKISGYSFKKCDKIARNKGIELDDPQRVSAAIVYQLDVVSNEGHCWVDYPSLESEVLKLLQLTHMQYGISLIHTQLNILMENDQIGYEETTKQGLMLSPYWLHRKEMELIEIFNESVQQTDPTRFLDCIYKAIMQTENGIEDQETFESLQNYEIARLYKMLNEKQKDSVFNAFCYNLTLTSGYAGTGKTTSLELLCKVFKKCGLTIALCAPTGKAARRMSETTGLKALTIHRLLEYSMANKDFSRNKFNKLEYDFIAVDEASMLSTELAWSLFQAINLHKTRVLMLGDHNQLCPIQPGNLLRDLIQIQTIPTITLDQIMRAKGSLQRNAKTILDGIIKPNSTAEVCLNPERNGMKDWNILEHFNNIDEMKEFLFDCLTSRLPKYNFDVIREVQVISPQKQAKSQFGTFHLNIFIQKVIQKHIFGVEVEEPKTARKKSEMGEDGEEFIVKPKFYVGDKVIQRKNNYDLNLVNGEIGYIKDIKLKPSQRQQSKNIEYIEFDFSTPNEPNKVFTFSVEDEEVKNIELAYALTIHSMQGSECPCIIAICVKEHSRMLHRNLLYTAVTRAKETAIVLGNKAGIQTAAFTKEIDKRRTFTKHFLNPLQEHLLARIIPSMSIGGIEKLSLEKYYTTNSDPVNTENNNVANIDKTSLVSENLPMRNIVEEQINIATHSMKDRYPLYKVVEKEVNSEQ